MGHKKRKPSPADGSYVCPSCGETIEIQLDRTSGVEQEYVEDCPVCCRPNVIHVEFFEGDEPARVWADAE
jgi:DNA replicative helicase MCM subunit Mcm2 (Cdc46/Mcm family)